MTTEHDHGHDADPQGWFGGPEPASAAGSCPRRWSPRSTSSTVAWQEAMADPAFVAEFEAILRDYAGIPSPLYFAERLSDKVGARILLKREDLNHTGAHKIRNVLGQALLTRRMGKTRVIAETGAGQHGVASATAAAYFGLDCTVYMGAVDTRRQALNVARMHLLGAKVVPVESGSATLKDAINEALREWVASVDHTAYLFGTAAGPHPFPSMVRDFTRGIGDEARAQCLERYGVLPDAIAACVGGGSNAIGLFTAFLDDAGRRDLRLRGRRRRRSRPVATPPRSTPASAGVLHGARTYVLQDEDGQTIESHSISAGLDYPGVGPQHAHLAATGRATYLPVTDDEAMQALALLSRTEGIIPAVESAHAIAGALKVAEELAAEKGPEATMLINLSGRGDKDMGTAIEYFGLGQDEVTEETGRMSVAPPSTKASAEGRAALVGYLPAGYPDVQGGIDALLAMVDAGCDVIEIGLPYSDPVMDGPTIQAAAQQALERGVRTPDVLRTVEAVAATGTPTVVMTYWNPVERYGVARFAADLANAGGAGLITPDLTPDSGPEWIAAADEHDLDKVFLVAPSSTDDPDRDDHGRLPRLRLRHRRHGRHRRPRRDQRPGRPAGRAHQGSHRRRRPDLPVGVGLGVSNGDQAAEVASYADGVIVGSAFVRALLDHPGDSATERAAGLRALSALTEDLARGVRRA